MITNINIRKDGGNWRALFTFDERAPFTFGSGDTLEDFIDGVKEIVNEYKLTGLKQTDEERAIEAIRTYSENEFDSDADFADLSKIGIGYTTTEDEAHEMQWYADLKRPRLYAEIDGEYAFEQTFPSVGEIADYFENFGEFVFEGLMEDSTEWIEKEERK